VKDERFQIDDDARERELRTLATLVDEQLPEGRGFAIFLFDMNTKDGQLHYLSNATRESMHQALREFLAKDAAAHPRGKLTPNDEGQLSMAVGVKEDCVVLSFEKPTAWLGMPVELARQLARHLLEKADTAERHRH